MIVPIGDDALFARTDEPQGVIAARAHALRMHPAFAEAVPTSGGLTVVFDPLVTPRAAAAALLEDFVRRPAPVAEGAGDALTVRVRYDGPDLPAVAEAAGMTPRGVAEAHASAAYTVLFLGFTPGFAYLGGVPDVLADVPRLAVPRVRTPAGSVGIAGGRTGVYALGGPGGWPVIGRTEDVLLDARTAAPAMTPGRPVRFVPVR